MKNIPILQIENKAGTAMKLFVTPWKNNRHNGRIKFQVEDI